MIDIFDTNGEPEPPEVEILLRANVAENAGRLINLYHTAIKKGMSVDDAVEETLKGRAGERIISTI